MDISRAFAVVCCKSVAIVMPYAKGYCCAARFPKN